MTDSSSTDQALAVLRGGDYIRAECATGLGYTGRREAIPALVDAYRHDPGIYVRCDAILALGRLGAADLVPEWLSKFSEESFEVQKRIVLAIHLMERAVAEPALRSLRMELAAGATVLREMIDERLRTLR